MLSYIDKIKEISTRLLKEGQVEMIIGFRKGTVPMMNEPHFAKSPEEVENFVWDSNCGINLCNYLTNRAEKIGILAKGCDSRNIVTHIIENKIKRDQLVIIGVPCKGMLDKRKISTMFEGEIGEVIEDENNITVKGDGFEKTLNKMDVLQQNCSICIHRNPVIHCWNPVFAVTRAAMPARFAIVPPALPMNPGRNGSLKARTRPM
jgi:coenzyme F420-reducing hydrogenase beta subunit